MKDLEKYMAMPFRMEVVKDLDESGFVVYFPDLPGCISCGKTIEKALANAEDAKRHGWKLHLRKESGFMNLTVWRITPDSLSCGSLAVCIVLLRNILNRKVPA